MLTVFYTGRKNGWVLVLVVAMVASCHTDTTQFSAEQSALVCDSVRQLAEGISRDVSYDGPAAWLKYFEASPEFYMASEGVCVFPDINSATRFINTTLIKEVR